MKRILIVFFTVLAVFAIASCKNEPEHEHTWDAGTDNGNGKMVYECTGCHESTDILMHSEQALTEHLHYAQKPELNTNTGKMNSGSPLFLQEPSCLPMTR